MRSCRWNADCFTFEMRTYFNFSKSLRSNFFLFIFKILLSKEFGNCENEKLESKMNINKKRRLDNWKFDTKDAWISRFKRFLNLKLIHRLNTRFLLVLPLDSNTHTQAPTHTYFDNIENHHATYSIGPHVVHHSMIDEYGNKMLERQFVCAFFYAY